jgi:hypothetical protein
VIWYCHGLRLSQQIRVDRLATLAHRGLIGSFATVSMPLILNVVVQEEVFGQIRELINYANSFPVASPKMIFMDPFSLAPDDLRTISAL